MQIHGFQKTTLLDYPGHLAATIFLGGCNFLCPFCHNKDLVINPQLQPTIPFDDILKILEKRANILDGVCITGGEPTLYPELESMISSIKELGLLVKLDTNGSKPDIIKNLVKKNLLDYIAMDIKGPLQNYPKITDTKMPPIENIKESIDFIKAEHIPYEFRTTVVRELHTYEDFKNIGLLLDGAKTYYLQAYKDSEQVIKPGFSSYSEEELRLFIPLLQPHIKSVQLRGV